MLFLLSNELWQTVSHAARKPAVEAEIWRWTANDFGDDLLLRTCDRQRTLQAVIDEAVEKAREPVSIVVASGEFSGTFEQVVESLAARPEKLRISLMIASPLDVRQVAQCREFMRKNGHLQSRISTFFLASRSDTEFVELDPKGVSKQYQTFLRLLFGGGRSLASALGIFRAPPNVELDGEPDWEELGEATPVSTNGILAAFGVRSWMPDRDKIVRLTEDLLSRLVAIEERRAAAGDLIQAAGPSAVIETALSLGVPEDAPLDVHHFIGEIPEPPNSPFETWRVPFSTARARKQRHHLRRVVQRNFTRYTASLKSALEEVASQLHHRCAAAFAEASKVYRSEVFQEADLGTVAFLARSYFPAFAPEDPSLPDDPAEVHPRPGWLPDDSYDCFCDVHHALEEGLDDLPGAKTWAGAGVVAVAFFVGGWILQGAGQWVSLAFVLGGFLTPVVLGVYRQSKLRDLRRKLLRLSEETFQSLRNSFESEFRWMLQQAGLRLEQRIRLDASAQGERLRRECETIRWLSPEFGHNGTQEIRRLKSAILETGIDDSKYERLVSRLPSLAKTVVERSGRESRPALGPRSQGTPGEIVGEWIDDMIESAVLPLETVEESREEIVEVAGAWRSPPLMTPLTDAEFHHGFRKVVVLPDSDIGYQHLQEALPKFSGNSVVSLHAWRGSAPGVAICSVMTGLPESILGYRGNLQAQV